jgi:hypothetical protein
MVKTWAFGAVFGNTDLKIAVENMKQRRRALHNTE